MGSLLKTLKGREDVDVAAFPIIDPTTLIENTWTEYEFKGQLNVFPRWRIAAISTAGENGEIYIIGGTTVEKDYAGDLFVINPCTLIVCEVTNEVVKGIASRLGTKGDKPFIRENALMVLVGEKLIGKVLANKRLMSSLWRGFQSYHIQHIILV
jgi:hypothetical protein